jgi:hypothetical protein
MSNVISFYFSNVVTLPFIPNVIGCYFVRFVFFRGQGFSLRSLRLCGGFKKLKVGHGFVVIDRPLLFDSFRIFVRGRFYLGYQFFKELRTALKFADIYLIRTHPELPVGFRLHLPEMFQVETVTHQVERFEQL